MSEQRKRGLHLRGLTSFAVTGFFVVMAASGVALYLAPRGRDADWTGWRMLSLVREQWVTLHLTVATLFLVIGVVHLVLNWRPLWAYVRSRSARGLQLRRELVVATALLLAAVGTAVYDVPPASTLDDWGEQIKDYWAARSPQGPFPHAELMTLDELAVRAGLPAEEILASLRSNGYEVHSTSSTLMQLAEANGTSPARVFDDLRATYPQVDRIGGRGRHGRRGR